MLNLRPVREHRAGWNLVMEQLHAEERLRQHALRLRVQDGRDKPIGVYDIILPEDDPGARFADQRTIQVVGDVVAKHPLGVERDQVRQTHLGREAIIILIDRKHVSRHEHRGSTLCSCAWRVRATERKSSLPKAGSKYKLLSATRVTASTKIPTPPASTSAR